MTAPVKFFETSTDQPFRRVNVPPTHRFGSDEPEVLTPSIGDRISGDGYACGCRSIKDYDKKIG
ncbi:MAG: hypothetical protein H7066_17870, partial [Cytophagaceae bacterium]|nr:hypothetical protein [Gemmatimonadaceae bacterium]